MLLSGIMSVNGQVSITGSTPIKTARAPFTPSFEYTYSQTIYLSSEINATGNITSIEWFYEGTNSLPYSRDIVVYLGTTSKTEFTSVSDFVPVANLTKVFDGKFYTNGTTGWKKITLPASFSYNGTDNLVVAVDENTTGSDSSAGVFYNLTVDKKRSLTNWGDAYNWNPTSPGSMCCGIDSGWATTIPYIRFGGITQTCAIPKNVVFSNITTTTATVSWQSTTVPSGGTDMYYSTSITPPDGSSLFTNIATGTTTSLSGLNPGTDYYVWLRNACSSTNKSTWTNVSSFRTDCTGVTDFIENFDSVTTPELPSCWRKIIKGADLSTGATIISSGNSIPESSPNIVELYNGTATSSADIILVSPNLSNLSAGTHHLVFYGRGRDVILQIGTMDKNDETGLFTPFTSISPNKDTMTKYDIDFTGYRGNDHYIALRIDVSGIVIDFPPHYFMDVDSFKWESKASCPDVVNMEALSTATTSATIGWEAVAANYYQVVVGDTTVTDPSTLTPTAPTEMLSVTINGLSEGKTYKYWVRSKCTNQDGNWQGPKTFTTSCSPIVSFNETFDTAAAPNLPTCWGKIIRGTTVSDFSYIETISFSKDVQMHTHTSNASDDVILVSPNLSTLKLGTYRLRFYAKRNSEMSSLQVGTLSTNTNAAVFNLVQNITLTEDMQQFTVEFNNYTGNDTFIGIRMNNFSSFSYVTVDNIVWELSPVCPDVSNINILAINPESAVIGWTEGGGETSWQFAVGNSTATDPNSLTPVKVDGYPTKEVTGLTPDTNYNVWVRSYCSATELGYWVGPVSFKTVCAPTTFLNENFESAVDKNLPNCWGKIIRGYNPETDYPPVIESWQGAMMPESTTAAYMMNKSDAGTSSDIILVTPSISNLALGTYRLRFTSKGKVDLQLGTLNSNLDTAVFTSFQTVKSTTNPTEYAVDFSSSYGTTDKYIGIRLSSTEINSNVMIDNVIWEPLPPCPDVTQIKLSGTTMNSALIEWNSDLVTKWQVAVGNDTSTDPNLLVPVTVENTPIYFIENLTPASTYNVWVRTVCDSGYGLWSEIVVTTQCTSTTVPYILDFETAVLPNLPTCTSKMNLANSPTNWYTSNNPGYGFESNTLVYDSDLYTDANAWFFTRGIELSAGNTYYISFRYGGASDSMFYYENSLKVMYGTEANPGNMMATIVDMPSFAVTAPVPVTASITPSQTGVYYFGFNVYSPNNSNFMFIDDIRIDQNLANNQFDVSQLSYYPNPVKESLTISNNRNISTVAVYNLLGQRVLVQSINNVIGVVDMSGLTKGAYMLKVTSENQVKTIKIVKD